MKLRSSFDSLTRFERCLWGGSLAIVILSFIIGGQYDPLLLIASSIGVTALIFVARGNVLGQILTVVFSLLYAAISLRFRYYGEMITYLGMTAPIAVMAVVAWSRNPYKKGHAEVKVARLGAGKTVIMLALAALVTMLFYYILKYFGTANLAISTVSITTSFIAAYLTLFRSPAYALAYAANDIVLIILWVLATMESMTYLPMISCFCVFLCNDIYGFFNWRKMQQRQNGRGEGAGMG